MRSLRNTDQGARYSQIATRGAVRSSLSVHIDIPPSLGIVGVLRGADDALYRARTSLFPLGFSSLLGHNYPRALPSGAGTTTDGGQLAELLQALLAAGLGARATWISVRRRGRPPDLTGGGLGHREKIGRGGQEVFKVPKDTPL